VSDSTSTQSVVPPEKPLYSFPKNGTKFWSREASVKRIVIAVVSVLGAMIASPIIYAEWRRISQEVSVVREERKVLGDRCTKVESSMEFQKTLLMEQRTLMEQQRQTQEEIRRSVIRIEAKMENR
jgi:hypothetical protein